MNTVKIGIVPKLKGKNGLASLVQLHSIFNKCFNNGRKK